MIFVSLLLLAAVQGDEIDCDGQQTQHAMNLCAQAEYDEADAALNAQWKITAAAMKARDAEIDRTYDKQPTHHETLLAGQRAWLIYRDKQCLSESFAARGGSMQPMLVSGCQSRLTKERTAQLKALIEEN